MRVRITIDEDQDTGEGMSLGINSDGADPFDIFRLLIAGAEMVVYGQVVSDLSDSGATDGQAEYGAPLRTRLLALDVLLNQEMQPYHWVHMDGLDLSPEGG